MRTFAEVYDTGIFKIFMSMRNYIIAALALAGCLVAAPVAEAAASAGAAGIENVAKPKKKTTSKTTKKKTATKKKTTTKATTNNTKVTKTATNAATNGTKLTNDTQAATNDVQGNVAGGQQSGGSVLGSIIGGLLGTSSASTSSSSSTGGLLSALTSVFDISKIANKNNIVGTWTYTEPAVVFSSDNTLKNIGGKVASQAIESKLQSQFEKFGIKKGTMQMTFDKDGNFTQTVGGKTLNGTYSVSGKSVTLKYAGQVQQFVGTTQLDGSDLLIVMDASKLLKYAKVLGSLTGNSLLSSAGSLLGSMSGMEVGLKLNK